MVVKRNARTRHELHKMSFRCATTMCRLLEYDVIGRFCLLHFHMQRFRTRQESVILTKKSGREISCYICQLMCILWACACVCMLLFYTGFIGCNFILLPFFHSLYRLQQFWAIDVCFVFKSLSSLSISRWLIHVVSVCVCLCVGAYHVVCMMLHFIITLGALAFKLANNACTLFIHILRWCCWWSRFFLSFSLSPLVHYLYLILQLAACVNAFW